MNCSGQSDGFMANDADRLKLPVQHGLGLPSVIDGARIE